MSDSAAQAVCSPRLMPQITNVVVQPSPQCTLHTPTPLLSKSVLLQQLTANRFSRRSILEVIHIIYRHIDTLSIRMQEFEARKEPLNISHAFPALTGDIIMDYFFGFNYNQLKHPEFESFHDAFIKIGGTGHVATQFPMILPVCRTMSKQAKAYWKDALTSITPS